MGISDSRDDSQTTPTWAESIRVTYPDSLSPRAGEVPAQARADESGPQARSEPPGGPGARGPGPNAHPGAAR
jgi:hypothetical protein